MKPLLELIRNRLLIGSVFYAILHVLGLIGVVIKQEWKALPYFALAFAFAVVGIRLGVLINARITAGENPVMNQSAGLLAALGLAAFAGSVLYAALI